MTPQKCDEDVYLYGEIVDIRGDLSKEEANELCDSLTNTSDCYRYDWYYVGGRVVIKCLGVEK